jgi:hypothetical protein
MKKFLALCFAISALGAFASDNAKQCKADCKEFVTQCEKGCEQQLKKKDPRALTHCKKNCNDFVKQCEKGCEDGKF